MALSIADGGDDVARSERCPRAAPSRCARRARASCSRAGRSRESSRCPGSATPSASQRQFIEFAVNMPLQLPHVGHADFLELEQPRVRRSRPPRCLPTPSNTVMRSTLLPLASTPARIGPPETNTVGRFARAAPISIPGTILSQFGMQIIASKQCARDHRLDGSRRSARATGASSACRRAPSRCRRRRRSC